MGLRLKDTDNLPKGLSLSQTDIGRPNVWFVRVTLVGRCRMSPIRHEEPEGSDNHLTQYCLGPPSISHHDFPIGEGLFMESKGAGVRVNSWHLTAAGDGPET